VRATCVGVLLLFICTVPDARTAAVLGQHAVGCVEGAYTAFQLAARQVGTHVAVGEDSDGPGLIDNERLKASFVGKRQMGWVDSKECFTVVQSAYFLSLSFEKKKNFFHRVRGPRARPRAAGIPHTIT